MPEYVLTIDGPCPATYYVNASGDQDAIAKGSVVADYAGETDHEVLGRRCP